MLGVIINHAFKMDDVAFIDYLTKKYKHKYEDIVVGWNMFKEANYDTFDAAIQSKLHINYVIPFFILLKRFVPTF